jgi:cysteinyl-tRNA synthetase
MLSIFNSKTREKEVFKPIHEGKVGMYVCGMTVYDYCHLGHARSFTAFDMIYRYLQYLGYNVNYVRNITDIEDKIIRRANENKESYADLTERMIKAMNEDFAAIGNLDPVQAPKATDYIAEMISIIETLVEKGLAYQGDNGDVYYAVAKFEGYGSLSRRKLDDMRAGERVDVVADKHDPMDFVLWKKAKPDEPSWDSPWGKGRPGWHIECSAMSMSCLDKTIDIHGGGRDLLFPHHENEIAQSEGANNCTFANYWLHAGFLQINDEKMSKSLGNFFTIRETLEKFRPEVMRYFFLMTHYRSPFNYSEQGVQDANGALERLYIALRGLPAVEAEPDSDYEKRFQSKMNDDFNTTEALSVFFELARDANRARDEGNDDEAAKYAAILKKLGGVLGVLQQDPDVFLKASSSSEDLSGGDIDQLIQGRKQARADKNWAEADRIRAELDAKGIVLEDKAGQTTWRRS